MFSTIKKFCNQLVKEFDQISPERKQLLERIAAYIKGKNLSKTPVNLVYVCTHNSRRSHFGQVWAHVGAHYYGVNGVHTFSGGTEATAFNPNAIAALVRLGFEVSDDGSAKNPLYEVRFSETAKPSLCFSKVYNHENNPISDFAAIMTCGDAEENCPFIPGCELRIATTYEDPKAFDHTPQQEEKYDERCRQIAMECLYVFNRVKN